MSDGTLTFDTRLDITDTQTAIKNIQKELQKLENKKLPLVSEFEILNEKMKEAKAKLAAVKAEYSSGKIGSVQYEKISDSLTAEIDKYSERMDKLSEKIDVIDRQSEHLEQSLADVFSQSQGDLEQRLQAAADSCERLAEETQTAAQGTQELASGTGEAAQKTEELANSEKRAAKEAKKAGDEGKKAGSAIGSSFGGAGSAVSNLAHRIMSIAKTVFVFQVIRSAIRSLKETLMNAAKTNTEFSNGLARVKGNLMVAFYPIYNAVMPAINALIQLLVKATSYIAAFISALFGMSMSESISGARALQNQMQAISSAASGVSAAERELTAAIKEKQRAVRALQRENKQLRREYEQQKKAIKAQTDELEKQIKTLQKEKSAIQASEDSMNKAAAAQREAIQANIDLLQKQQKEISKKKAAINKEQQQAQKAVDAQKASIDREIKSIQNQIKALQKQKKAAEEARKANQKFTASFDELSTLSSADEDDPYDLQIEQLQEQIDNLRERKELIEDVDYSKRLEALDAENEKIQEQIEKLQEAADAIKDVDYSDRTDAIESRITKIREKIDELNESLQENPLIEQNEEAIEALQEQIDKLQEQKDAIEQAGGAAGAFKTAFADTMEDIRKKIEDSPILQWFNENKERIKDFIKIFGGIVSVVATVTGAFKGLESLLGLLCSPAGLFVVFAGLIAKVIEDTDKTGDAIDALKDTFDGLVQFIIGLGEGDGEKAIEGLKKFLGGIADLFKTAAEAIQLWLDKKTSSWLDSITKWIIDLDEKIKNWNANRKKDSEEAAKETYSSTDSVFEIFSKLFKDANTDFKKSVSDTLESIDTKFRNWCDGLNKSLGDTFDSISEGWENFSVGIYKFMVDILNAILGTATKFINRIADGFEWIRDKLNSVKSALGFPTDDYTITRPKFEKFEYDVPALAQGAVLPPNKPFYALVGDQKNGTNIEAPLSTIEDAVRSVMSEFDFNFEITANGSLGALIRMLELEMKRENKRSTVF